MKDNINKIIPRTQRGGSLYEEAQELNEGFFLECKDCGYAWVDKYLGKITGTEDAPGIVFDKECPKCGSDRIRVEY